MPEPTLRIQFSTRTLLAFTTAVAGALGVLVAPGNYYGGLCALALALTLPALLTLGAMSSHSRTRAFFIGGLIPASAGAMQLLDSIRHFARQTISATAQDDELNHFVFAAAFGEERHRLAVFWTLIPLIGLACALAQRTKVSSERY